MKLIPFITFYFQKIGNILASTVRKLPVYLLSVAIVLVHPLKHTSVYLINFVNQNFTVGVVVGFEKTY